MSTTTAIPQIDSPAGTAQPRTISRWLLCIALLVFLMIVVGGITRLTESGLSMVRWEPVSGVIPPLSEAEWQKEFAAYKAYPEYQKINRGMSLGEFQNIFFWEYLHRLIARFIGIAFALPLIWFAWKRAIPKGYGPRLTGLFILGGLQGGIGWWMVASGLIDRPDVSHLRLATHLSAAFIILAALVWTMLDLSQLAKDPSYRPARFAPVVLPLAIVLSLQIVLGAFTAGLDAGFAFNTWPKMGDHWFPEGVPMLAPFWHNLVDNPVVVQFTHRTLAYAVAIIAVITAWHAARRGAARSAAELVGMTFIQFGLGIATIISGVALWIGVAHQAGAALLVVAMIGTAHRLGRQS